MGKYIGYLKYLSKHKYYILRECIDNGLYYQGIIHDLSKLRISEFIPYADFFYNKRRNDTGYYKPTDTGDKSFDFSWLLHQKRNKHHWQFWILPEDEGGLKVLQMPNKYALEMVCDWVGAGRAQGFHSPSDDHYKETKTWYEANKHKMQLHGETRRYVEEILYG